MPFITAENASELAHRSNEARRLRKERLANPIALQCLPQQDRYTIKRLMRVRRQIDSLSDDLDNEEDALKKDRLASAIARLSEIERQLANRPLPGSWKPQAPRPAARARSEPVALPQATISSVQPSDNQGPSPKS